MIERRVESEAWSVLSWIEFVFSFCDPDGDDPEEAKKAEKLKLEALEALKRYQVEQFKIMKGNPDIFFNPNDILLIEKFDLPATVLYLLELAIHNDVDGATQYEALVIAEKMFDHVVPEKELNKYTDKMLSVLVNKLPDIPGQTGMNRLMQAQLYLEKSQIQGLKDVPLVVEKEVGGEKQTKWKPYLSIHKYHPAKLIFGVAKDFLQPLVDKQREQLLAEWDKKWTREHPVAPPKKETEKKDDPAKEKKEGDKKAEAVKEKKGDKKAEATGDKKAAEAKAAPVKPKVVEKPDFTLDPGFATELEKRIDKNITPLVEDWLGSKLRAKRLFGIAGLKYLGTPGAAKLLKGLLGDKLDMSDYLGKGVTIALVAQNALKGIELAKEFDQLKLDAIRDKILSPDEVERMKQRMLADLAFTPEELEKKYREELRKRQERYQRQKEKLAIFMKIASFSFCLW